MFHLNERLIQIIIQNFLIFIKINIFLRSDKYEFSSFLTNNNQAKTVKFKDLEDARQNELSDNEVRLKKVLE